MRKSVKGLVLGTVVLPLLLFADLRERRVEFSAVLPERSGLTVSFGRGKEKFTLDSQADGYRWLYLDANGVSARNRPCPGTTLPDARAEYWWEKSVYTPNGRYKRTFGLPEDIFRWSEYLYAMRYKSPDVRKLAVAVEVSDGLLKFLVDGILVHATAATEEHVRNRLSVEGRGEARISAFSEMPAVSTPGFYRIPFGEVATLGNNPVAKGGVVDGVPFLGSPKSVDLSKSWVREACMDEYGEPCNGAFGGRWAGALSADPCRLQFRVPNLRYDALFLLASCRGDNSLAVQFYRPSSGFPVGFVPVEPIPADGVPHLVRIPLDQDKLALFADRETIEFELVARENVYRSTPEPCHTSLHGGGAPSGVKVHAMTLRKADLLVDFTPDAFGNVWVGLKPHPSYRVRLTNASPTNRTHRVVLESRSYDGSDCTSQSREISVAAGSTSEAKLDVPVKKYGWHGLRLLVDGVPHDRTLTVLKEREYGRRPFDTRGHMFGCWPAGTTHWNLPAADASRLSMPLGVEAIPFGPALDDPVTAELARRYGVQNFAAFGDKAKNLKDPHDPDLAAKMDAAKRAPSDVYAPAYQWLYAEPGGIGETYVPPELCGEEGKPRTEEQEKLYVRFKTGLQRFEPLFREKYPGVKLLMPWGTPVFGIPFLKDPETRNLFDGMAYDSGLFDRIPEAELGQCSLYAMTLFNREWTKYRKGKPTLISIEGPCLSRVAPGALTERQSLDYHMRSLLILSANGVNRLLASVDGHAENQSYWGEQHYNSGAFTGTTLNPRQNYAGQGTLIRILKNAEFVRSVPTGSLAVYNLEYRDTRDGSPINILWCIRGRVPFTVRAKSVLDAMDNEPLCREVTTTPVFILGAEGAVELGQQEFDLADVTPAEGAVKVGDCAKWSQVSDPGEDGYLNSFPSCVRRHPVEMCVSNVSGKLSVALPSGVAEYGVMPLFTTLVPPKPIPLPGRPGRIAVETTVAAADWGRVVFVLRDAQGKEFVSVGGKDVWNCDDTPHESYFNFEGTRLIRMELPATHPWDGFRSAGFVWWGMSGGSGRIAYPLSLVKIHVERRTKMPNVNDILDTPREPVLLGAVYVEDVDRTNSPKMPLPPSSFKPVNPLAEIKGTLPPTKITGIRKPDHYYDGTRGHFDFDEVEGAVGYDIYVSTSETGDGAILLGKNVRASGTLVNGFRPNRDNFAFIVWRDKKGNVSSPSAPFKFRTVDEFSNK